MKVFNWLIYGSLCILGLSSCATFKTLDAHLPLEQRMFVYSGTRLDWAAIVENDAALRKFKVSPPTYPVIDLPLSFALDTIFFPLAVGAEVFH
ncbi:MAG: YceK/YidQ family lipoprotein [Methylococcales bacterium]|nr:YceK/YidQ family lipoprotein [Methylococcales bacterium]